MRIALIITRGDSIGGAQIHVLDLACQLTTLGHQVQVFLGGGGTLSKELEARGIAVEPLKFLIHPVRPLRDALALVELVGKLRNFGPDLIAAHSSKAGLLARIAGKLIGVPSTFTAHGWAFTEGVKPTKRTFYRLLERMVAPLAEKLICVSDYDRLLAINEQVADHQRLVTIHNGIPDLPDRGPATPAREPARLVMVARLQAPKDHETLFQALQALPSVHLTLVGDGPRELELRELSDQLGIGDRVAFLGHRSDIHERLCDAQIFVLATRYEGFPLSILEAMRAGLPVVATDVGGVKEAVVEGETGFLVPKENVGLLRDRLFQLVHDPDLRSEMGAAGRRRFLERFTLPRMLEQTVAVYHEIVGGAK